MTGAKDKSVIIWNFKHGSVNHKLSLHTDIIVKVAITFDGNVVISGKINLNLVVFILISFASEYLCYFPQLNKSLEGQHHKCLVRTLWLLVDKHKPAI